jgi:hypothetical protein
MTWGVIVRCTTARRKKYWAFSNKASEIFSPPLNFLARVCGWAVFVAHFLGSNQKKKTKIGEIVDGRRATDAYDGPPQGPALQLASQTKIR